MNQWTVIHSSMKNNDNYHLRMGFYIHKEIRLPSKRIDIISERKIKLKLSLCLTKYHDMNTYPMLN